MLVAQATHAEDLTLWYQQPATEWTEALPVGNGRLGAMVFGGITEERLQLNEESVWAGPPVPEPRPGVEAVVREAGQPRCIAWASIAVLALPPSAKLNASLPMATLSSPVVLA